MNRMWRWSEPRTFFLFFLFVVVVVGVCVYVCVCACLCSILVVIFSGGQVGGWGGGGFLYRKSFQSFIVQAEFELSSCTLGMFLTFRGESTTSC